MTDREWLISLVEKLPDEKIKEIINYVEHIVTFGS